MNGPTPGAITGTTSYRAGGSGLDWYVRSACRQHDPELWYVTGRDTTSQADRAKAKRICGDCPVLLECRRHALDNREPYGIWGGLEEDEREAIHTGGAPRRPVNSSDAWKAGQEAMNAVRRANALKDRDELAAEIEHLADQGADVRAAARATGRTAEALERALYRAGRPDLVARLKRSA